MPNLESKLINMQNQVSRLKYGYCILVKLINFEELYAMLGSAQDIIDDLNKIVRMKCMSYCSTVFSQIDYNKILVVLPKVEDKSLKKLVLAIYSSCQLYLNDELPSAYINCQIVTANFPENGINAIELYTALLSVIANPQNDDYYYKYDKKLHNINIIADSNIKLNLLRKALANNTRTFNYQPIIDRKTREVLYYECLLRIPDSDDNMISIGSIIEDAESKGLINIIDQTVFKMAVEELSCAPDTNLAVNISNYGILDNNLLELAQNLLKKYKVSHRLIIEITESSLNKDYERTRIFMNRLHNFGCRFALDDFGSGFTSFEQLKNLPVDIIKIDGSYVRNIVSNHHSKYFIETLVKISEELGMKTVAEYVENGEIAKFLIDIKVDGMQGNFFSPASRQRH